MHNEEAKPFIEVQWRPLLRAVVKTGFLLFRNVKAAGMNVCSQANQLVAEARAELDEDERKTASPVKTGDVN